MTVHREVTLPIIIILGQCDIVTVDQSPSKAFVVIPNFFIQCPDLLSANGFSLDYLVFRSPYSTYKTERNIRQIIMANLFVIELYINYE